MHQRNMPLTVHQQQRLLGQAFGVTRLARLTGLDRLGIEVVGAVRPLGHVLQVSQGKGHTLEQARWSAVGEAIELSAAESPEVSALRFGPAPDDSRWDVGTLSIAWAPGQRARDGAAAWVPAETVYCPPAGRCWLGPSVASWTSNGLGMHPTSHDAAVEHALLELLERDALARVLPSGWTERAAFSRLRALPPNAAHFRDRGFQCFAFDLTPNGHPLHVAGALLFDLESQSVPLTAGYACRRSFHAALDAAILEAAQSRLTEIHGAREDVLTGEREAGLSLLQKLERRGPAAPPVTQRHERRRLSTLVPKDVVVVTLREHPFVVKAVSPSLQVSKLL